MAELRAFTAQRVSVGWAPWVVTAAAVAVALAAFAATLGERGFVLPPWALVPVLLVAASVAFVVHRTAFFTRRDAVEVRLDAAGMWLGPRAFVSRDEVSQGFLLGCSDDGEWMVRLERWGLRADLRLIVPGPEEGRAILSALRLGVDRHTATFHGMARFHALSTLRRALVVTAPPPLLLAAYFWFLQAETAANVRAAANAQLVLFPLAVAFYLVLGVTRTRIDVGSDGVLVRWLGRERFHRHADIARVRVTEGLVLTGVDLELHGGDAFSMPVGTRRLDGGLARELGERIEDARAHASQARTHGAEVALERRGRPASAWLSGLRNVGAGANADMRTAIVSLDDLAAVLLDPTSPPATRAAAAVAAVAADPFEGRARVRIAHASCAHKKLKVALRAVLRFDASDAEISRALGRLEGESA